MQKLALKITVILCAVVFGPRAASAQPAVYVAGSGFADVKLFGSGTIYYPATGEPSLNSTGGGGGVRVGTFVHPRVSLEFGVDVGSRTKTTFPFPAQILALTPTIYPSPLPTNLEASTQFLTVSTIAGYHPAPIGKVRLGFLGGFSVIRGTYKSDLPGYVLPAATFTAELRALGLPPPTTIFAPRSVTTHNFTGGFLLGFEAAFEITNRLAIVPEVRSVMFSQPTNGPGVFLVRPGLSVRWGF